MTQRSPQRLHPTSLSLSARRMYAQVLAERIHANAWTQPAKRMNYGDAPSFQVRGAGMIPTPLVIEARTGGHGPSGVPAARILLGNETYYATILELTDREYAAWVAWLEPVFDKHRQRVKPPALFRPQGPQWSRNEHTNRPEQDASLRVLDAATIHGLSTPPEPP